MLNHVSKRGHWWPCNRSTGCVEGANQGLSCYPVLSSKLTSWRLSLFSIIAIAVAGLCRPRLTLDPITHRTLKHAGVGKWHMFLPGDDMQQVICRLPIVYLRYMLPYTKYYNGTRNIDHFHRHIWCPLAEQSHHSVPVLLVICRILSQYISRPERSWGCFTTPSELPEWIFVSL